MKVLCVAEKPSIAKSVAEILSGSTATSREGRSRYCRNFDLIYRLNGRDAQVVVTSVLGHLLQQDFEQGYNKNWSAYPPEMLFDIGVVKSVNPQHIDVQHNIEQEARHADMLVIWTDCDREGENIGAEIAFVCCKINRRIQVKRARFSVIQNREIHQAMQLLGELDMRQSEAVEARSELDLRIGASFTRFMTLRYGPQYADLNDKIISYGSCQFPTLGFIVDQYLKVENFVPEDFWKIKVGVQRDGNHADFTWKRDRLFDQHFCLALYERCVQAPVATVCTVQTKPTSKWTPLPMTTVELQKMGSKFLRMPSNVVMEVAEKLYNAGFLSYPRTETDQFDDNFELRPLIESQTADSKWGQYAQRLLEGGFRKPRKGKNNDKAHPPIHTTKHAANLTGDEQRVYELVARRFLACCSENGKGFETVVETEVAAELFTAKGLMITERNFLDVYPYERWNTNVIPVFQLGESFLPTSCEMVPGSTSRPLLLSEAELITLMDKNGIGTDATIHEHIKKVIDRAYVMKTENNLLSPSTLGVALVEGYDRIGMEVSLAKPFLRAEMEKDMKRICEGVKTRQQVVRASLIKYKQMYRRAVTLAYMLDMSLTKYLGYEPDVSNDGRARPRPHDSGGNGSGSGGGRGGGNDGGGSGSFGPSSNKLRPRPIVDTRQDGSSKNRKLIATKPTHPLGSSQTHIASGFKNQFNTDDNGRPNTPESTNTALNDRRCRCGLLAVQRITNKDENAGRHFWVCPKESKTSKCSYFEWSEASANVNISERTRSNTPIMGQGRQRSEAESGSSNNTRVVCYKCQQPGHFANNCSTTNGSYEQAMSNNPRTSGRGVRKVTTSSPRAIKAAGRGRGRGRSAPATE